MIKPKQIPDAAAFALNDAQKDPDASPWDLIAAALNAWPGMEHQTPNEWSNHSHIILPLQENSNDKG